jgi:hypothetical protein
MARQLDLFKQTRGAAVQTRAFVRQPTLDRSGAAAYVHLIRALDDPERPSRPARELRRDVSPHLTLRRTTTVEQWRTRLVELLGDGVPRTFNRIGIELCGLTADILFSTPADPALWSLVDDGAIEMTLEAPILFRRAT